MTAAARPRVGLLGGTFDPIHAGHVALALAAREAAELSEVRLLAARRSPHKARAAAAAAHRHAMVALATQGPCDLVADPREAERPEPSFTIDTVEEIARERGDVELFLIVGADSLRDLPSWHRLEDLLRRARLVVAGRAGLSARDALAAAPAAARDGATLVDETPPPWSATGLRADLAAGREPPPGALAPPVLDYIRKHALYGPVPAPFRARIS